MAYSHRPIIVGPMVVRHTVIGPLLLDPGLYGVLLQMGTECPAGSPRTAWGLDIVVIRMCSRVPR